MHIYIYICILGGSVWWLMHTRVHWMLSGLSLEAPRPNRARLRDGVEPGLGRGGARPRPGSLDGVMVWAW